MIVSRLIHDTAAAVRLRFFPAAKNGPRAPDLLPQSQNPVKSRRRSQLPMLITRRGSAICSFAKARGPTSCLPCRENRRSPGSVRLTPVMTP